MAKGIALDKEEYKQEQNVRSCILCASHINYAENDDGLGKHFFNVGCLERL